MAIPLAKLVVQLEAENSKLHGALDRSTRRLNRFEGSTKRVGASVGRLFKRFAAPLTGLAFIGATKGALDYADSIDKAGKVSGLTTDEIQELRFAGDQLGISNKLVDEGFRRFSRRLGEFANSGAGPAEKAMKGLDIQIRDSEGAVRSTGDVFDELVAKMEGIESQAQRSAIAAQVFGDDAGPKLELLLAKGVAGIDALSREAHDIGAILSEEVIANAVIAKDDLTKLSRVLKVQLTAALVELAPLLSGAANGLLDIAREARAAFGDINTLSKASAELKLTNLLEQLDRLQGNLENARRAENSGALKDQLLGLVTISPERLQERIDETEGQIRAAYARISSIDFSAANAQPPALIDFDFEGTTTKTDALTAAEKRLAAVLAQAKNPADGLTQTFVDLNALLDAGTISWDTYTKAVFDAQDKIDTFGAEAVSDVKPVDDAARELGLTFSSAFEDAALEGEKLRDVVRGLAEDILRIALRKSVTEPLATFVSDAVTGFFAAGTSFAPGGLAVVGERGRELVHLPRGSSVTPAGQFGGGLVINVDARGSTDPLETRRQVRRAVSESVALIRSMKTRGKLPEFA